MDNACQAADEVMSQLGPAEALSADIAWHRNPLRTAQWSGCHKILPHTSQSMESRKESKEDAAWKLGASAVWTGTRTNTHKKRQWNKIPISKEPLGLNHLQLMLKLAKHVSTSLSERKQHSWVQPSVFKLLKAKDYPKEFLRTRKIEKNVDFKEKICLTWRFREITLHKLKPSHTHWSCWKPGCSQGKVDLSKGWP